MCVLSGQILSIVSLLCAFHVWLQEAEGLQEKTTGMEGGERPNGWKQGRAN